jgi:3-isopropylmalate/(R)-2-methylmalate dehydratase small subunit
MPTFTSLTSRVVVLAINDVDTDQIIPARFLKATDKAGMGDHLFADWRYHPDGSPRADFILNQADCHGAQVLLAGDNFGCGSSREHAPWALTGYGFRAIVSTSFADIFSNNALKNGLLPVVVDAATHERLSDMIDEVRQAQVTIDLPSQTLLLPDGTAVTFPIDGFAKTCLLQGVDELGYLQSFEAQISAYEQATADA